MWPVILALKRIVKLSFLDDQRGRVSATCTVPMHVRCGKTFSTEPSIFDFLTSNPSLSVIRLDGSWLALGNGNVGTAGIDCLGSHKSRD